MTFNQKTFESSVTESDACDLTSCFGKVENDNDTRQVDASCYDNVIQERWDLTSFFVVGRRDVEKGRVVVSILDAGRTKEKVVDFSIFVYLPSSQH